MKNLLNYIFRGAPAPLAITLWLVSILTGCRLAFDELGLKGYDCEVLSTYCNPTNTIEVK